MSPRPPTRLLVPLVAMGYLALAAASMLLANAPGNASPVFPAAGAALASVLVYGLPALPGVWLGSAMLVTGSAIFQGGLTPSTAAAAVVAACGATAQTLAGWWLVTRWPGADWRRMEREQDAVRFVLLGGVLAALVSATVGVGGLVATGIVPPAEAAFSWWTWYVGDALGIVVFAPLSLGLLDRDDPLWRERRRVVAPLLVVLVLTGLAFHGAALWESRARMQRLEDDAQSIAQGLGDHLIAQREVLASIRNLAEAIPDFTFEQFEQFTRLPLRHNPDIAALAFTDLVAGEDREHVAVRFIVPVPGNEPAVGFDVQSEPIRAAAIAEARFSGSLSITAPVQLEQEPGQRTGILALLPVTDPTSTLPGGTPHTEGFAVAVIRVDEMVEIATRGRVPPGRAFEITDAAAPAGRNLLYRSPGWIEVSAQGGALPRWSTSVRAGHREWKLTVAPAAGAAAPPRPWGAWAVGVVGLLLAGLFQLLLLGMTGRADLMRRKNDELGAVAAALRASEERLKEAQRLAHMGHWEHDLQTNALTCSDEVFRIYELDPARAPVTVRTFLEAVHPGDRAAVDAAYQRSLATGAAFALTHRLQSASGRLKYVDLRCETVPGPDGKPVRWSGTAQDVTEVRELQEKLVNASRLAALGTLVAGVGHEINNPLAAALANDGAAFSDLDELRHRLRAEGARDDAAIVALLDDIQESVGAAIASDKRIATIVKDLVRLGRPEGEHRRVPVMDVVDQALRWLHVSVSHHATIQVVNEAPPDVIGSAGQLGQVLINLVTNGARAIPPDRKGVIVIRVGRGGPGTAAIEVTDNGVGMTPEVMARIFDPFFTTRDVGQGMGLGLAICHSIVQAHGGNLTVTSRVGEGSTFRIELPAAPS